MSTESTNKPGLAKFSTSLPDNSYGGKCNYVTVMPYNGKLVPYMKEISELASSLADIFSGTDISIGYETITFDTYAEAKAAAVGAGFVGGEDFFREANIGEPTVESLKRAINEFNDFVICVGQQMEETGSVEEDELWNELDDVFARAGLWYT